MITKFTDIIVSQKEVIKSKLTTPPEGGFTYLDLVTVMVGVIRDSVARMDLDEVLCVSIAKITEISYGDYKGTSVFVIGGDYSSTSFYSTNTYYGSCTECDLLMRIHASYYCDSGKSSNQQLEDYYNLILNLAQKLIKIA